MDPSAPGAPRLRSGQSSSVPFDWAPVSGSCRYYIDRYDRKQKNIPLVIYGLIFSTVSSRVKTTKAFYWSFSLLGCHMRCRENKNKTTSIYYGTISFCFFFILSSDLQGESVKYPVRQRQLSSFGRRLISLEVCRRFTPELTVYIRPCLSRPTVSILIGWEVCQVRGCHRFLPPNPFSLIGALPPIPRCQSLAPHLHSHW